MEPREIIFVIFNAIIIIIAFSLTGLFGLTTGHALLLFSAVLLALLILPSYSELGWQMTCAAVAAGFVTALLTYSWLGLSGFFSPAFAFALLLALPLPLLELRRVIFGVSYLNV